MVCISGLVTLSSTVPIAMFQPMRDDPFIIDSLPKNLSHLRKDSYEKIGP
jgi:hypothetical protein